MLQTIGSGGSVDGTPERGQRNIPDSERVCSPTAHCCLQPLRVLLCAKDLEIDGIRDASSRLR